MSNDINELRRMLFDTMRRLTDKDSPLEVERAKAVSEVAQTIINSAKVEVEMMKQTGAEIASSFVKLDKPAREPVKTQPREPAPQLVSKIR